MRSETWGVKAPSIVNGSVYFNDLSSMAYALDLEDGTELWRQPGPGGTTFSTASSAVGHDQRLYNAFNMELSDSKGASAAFGAPSARR